MTGCACPDCGPNTDGYDTWLETEWIYRIEPGGIRVERNADYDRNQRVIPEGYYYDPATMYFDPLDEPDPDPALDPGTLVSWTTHPDQSFDDFPRTWTEGPLVVVQPTTAYQAHGIDYAYTVAGGGDAEQTLTAHGYVPSDHAGTPGRVGAAAIRGYRLPPDLTWGEVWQRHQHAADALRRLREPVLTIYHDAVRRHRHDEDLGQVVMRPVERKGPRPARSTPEDRLREDLTTRKAAVLARKDGRYGETELLVLYPDTGVLVSTYCEPPSTRPAVGPCDDAGQARADFGLDEPAPDPPVFPYQPGEPGPGSTDGLRRDIAHGRLRVHDRRRTPDGQLMALATYPDSGRAVHLLGEGDQRHIAARFQTTEQARAAWHQPRRRAPEPTPATDTTTARRTVPRHR